VDDLRTELITSVMDGTCDKPGGDRLLNEVQTLVLVRRLNSSEGATVQPRQFTQSGFKWCANAAFLCVCRANAQVPPPGMVCMKNAYQVLKKTKLAAPAQAGKSSSSSTASIPSSSSSGSSASIPSSSSSSSSAEEIKTDELPNAFFDLM
jgi:hypothetical protein